MLHYRNKSKTYIIAEIGVNHNGSIEKAKYLIDLAKNSGADAVKFQSFKADELARMHTPKVAYQEETMDESISHQEMLRGLELSEEGERALFEYCSDVCIDFISTPYSVDAVHRLDKIGVSEFKVASADIIDIPMLEAIASTKKPVILALGMATISEIERALLCFSDYKPEKIALLHCVSNYPCSDESLNLLVINSLREKFKLPIGFSDHSKDNTAAPIAVALGSVVIERHFTSDKTLEGPDHRASIEPDQFANLVSLIRQVERQLGSDVKAVQPEEMGMAKISRKSLIYAKNINKGNIFSMEDFTMKRPADGLAWDDIQNFIGKKAQNDCLMNDSASLNDIE